MFHKDDLLRAQYDTYSDDNQNDININPITSIISAIQKQQAKKTARLPKNNISDPMGVMIHNFIKLAGAQATPAKRIILLLSNKDKYDPKCLSNMSELLQTNRLEPLALMFVSTLEYYRRNYKTDSNYTQNILTLEETFKSIAYNILTSAVHVKIKSLAQDFHAAFCDADLDPHNADKSLSDRFNILNQQLQHQINDSYYFDSNCPCLRHNLSPPCKIKNCPWPHICRCGAPDHIITDKFCPQYHTDDEKLFKKIKGMNNYHSRRANKAFKYDRWRQYNGQYPINPSNNQTSNIRNDNLDINNNRHNKYRR